MAFISANVFLFLLIHSLLVFNANAVTCFGMNGFPYTNNLICPGSNACCRSDATCLPNRLCHYPGTPNDTFVRGACSLKKYDTNTCATICLYNETKVNHGFLPRVTLCTDGKYCCDNKPNCCENGNGVYLNDVGAIVPTPPNTSATPTTSLSSSTALPSSSTATTTSPQGAANTSSSEPSSSGLSTGAKIGIGVGVPIGVIAVGGLGTIIFLQQRRLKRIEGQVTANSSDAMQRTPLYAHQEHIPVLPKVVQPPKEMDANQRPALSELPGTQVER
ncbi:hypothetical protein F5884DRAFT_154763 [Xylogone sp. PMI_703]|nr:hypothetical protein F5884DRAFT_154763 [Xylogone sp. PMI_703]